MYNQDHSSKSSFASLMQKVYGWMSLALTITGGVAYYVANSPQLINMFLNNNWIFLFLVFAQLGLVVALSAFIEKLNYTSALAIFLLYSTLMGLTLSSIFLVYTAGSIAITFLVTAGMFAGMAVYGYFTNTDLSQIASILTMALWGMILAGLVNLFFKSSMVDTITSFIGIIVFAGLTAYDAQKIKALSSMHGARENGKLALLGALTLYLDFINLFLSILRFTGKQRD